MTLAPTPAARRRRRDLQPPLTVRQIRLPHATSFYSMTAQPVRGKIPWDLISESAGTLRTCFLLPAGVAPEKASGIRPFSPRILPQLLLFQRGLFELRARQLEARQTQITVVDEAAVLADRIGQLAPFARSLRVLTARPERFVSARQTLLEQCGLSLCVCGLAAPLPEEGVLFSLSGARVPRLFRGLLFTCDMRRLLFAKTVVVSDITLPPAIERLRPPEIDRIQFAAALFERCGVKELENVRIT